MEDISPHFDVLPAEKEINLPASFQDQMAQRVGSSLSSPSQLQGGNFVNAQQLFTYQAHSAYTPMAGDIAVLGLENGNPRIQKLNASIGASSAYTSDTLGTGLSNGPIQIISLSASLFVILFDSSTGSILKLIAGTIDASGTITYGSAVSITGSTTGRYGDIVTLDSTHFAVSFDTGAGVAKAVVGSISGTTITLGTVATLETKTAITQVYIDKLDSTHFVTTYVDTLPDARAVVCSVSGTTITVGTPVELEAIIANANNYMVLTLDSTHFATWYRTNTTITHITICSVSGTTITIGTPVSFGDVSGTTFSRALLDTTHFIVGGFTNSGTLASVTAVSVSGITPTIGANTTLGSSSGTKCFVIALSSSVAVAVYGEGNNIKANYLAISGTAITATTAITVFAGTLASDPLNIVYIDSGTFIVNYTSSGIAHAYICAVVNTTVAVFWDLNSTLTNNTTGVLMGGSSNWYMLASKDKSAIAGQISSFKKIVGVVTASVALGATVNVCIGGLSSGFTGLTITNVYYVQTNGVAGTTSTPYKLGLAASTTQIQLTSGGGSFQFF